MKISDRSYNSKSIRPKPIIFTEDDGSFLIIATPWGTQEHGQRVVDEISKYLRAAKVDMEVTSPFEFMMCFSDEVNHVRTAILMANEDLYRSENRTEYHTGIEVFVLYKKNEQIAWGQVGSPALLLKKQGISLQVLSAPLDLSTELASHNNQLPPLPSQLLGIENSCDVKVGHFHSSDNEQIILLAGGRLSAALWQESLNYSDLTSLTRAISKEEQDLAFWLGIVELS